MNREEVLQLIRQEFSKNELGSRYTITPTNQHNHDGIQSPRVDAVNLVYNNKARFGIFNDGDTTPGVSYLTVSTLVSNPTRIFCSGIARTPVSGTATTKTSYFGVAEIGNCFDQSTANVGGTKKGIMQMCTGNEFVDPGSGTYTPFVFTESRYIATSDTTTTNAIIEVYSITGTSIIFKCTIAAAWSMTADIIVT